MILIGSLSLGLLASEMYVLDIDSHVIKYNLSDLQAISNAHGAAAKLYQTIDRVPEIDSASIEGLKLEKAACKLVLGGGR